MFVFVTIATFLENLLPSQAGLPSSRIKCQEGKAYHPHWLQKQLHIVKSLTLPKHMLLSPSDPLVNSKHMFSSMIHIKYLHFP